MADVSLIKRGGKVLPFEQKSDFYYKRGSDKHDKNDLIEALSSYRRALEKEPDNQYTRLALAQVLTEMGRYAESNRILIPLLNTKDAEPECYYGMGCNFAGLNQPERARECLEQFVSMAPESDMLFDAYDMLDAIDELLYRAGDFGELAEVSREDMAFDAAEEGRRLLECEDYHAAREALERALKLDPKLYYARNNLSLLYFCKKEYKKALAETEAVLSMDPKNTQALCNKAVICSQIKNRAEANRVADVLLDADTDIPDELCRICLVLMELDRFEDAFGVAEKQLSVTPYDEGALHRYGVCAYETGRYDKAVRAYDKLCRIDPMDTIARYYRRICRAAQLNKPPERKGGIKPMAMNYQVPLDEMVNRINRLNELVLLPHEELTKLWQSSDELESLVRWGFTLPDKAIKKALLSVAISFQDKKAERVLRDFLLMPEQADDIKRHVFAALAAMGAQEPYVGYMNGKLVESRKSAENLAVSRAYKNALGICLVAMRATRQDGTIEAALAIWEGYIRANPIPPRISKAQVVALAAAIEYAACKRTGEKAAKSEICAKYGVSALRLKNALSKLSVNAAQEEE